MSSPWLLRGGLVIVAVLTLAAANAFGSCVVERNPSDNRSVFLRHAGTDCNEQDRAVQAIKAEDLLAAMQSGQGVDLERMIVIGDLHLEALPLVPLETVPDQPPAFREQARAQQVTKVRRIAGPVTIKDSIVRGTVTTGLKEGYLVFQGPVIFSGTTFEQAADFSRAVFFGSVDGSRAAFLAQSFFIQALFFQPARFEKTAFGVHTRFHGAVFGDTVSFLQATFNGLAEFLEVTFKNDVVFARSTFKMGTGFSGSRFAGRLDFSDALYERDVFFTFTRFEGDALFHRTTFRSTADFSDAQFEGADDFSKAFFSAAPRFARVKTTGARPSGRGQDPTVLYGLAATLFLITLFFLWTLRRRA